MKEKIERWYLQNDKKHQESIYQVLAIELRSRRLKSAKTLADIPGLSISYLSKIENNKIIPSREKLLCICREIDMAESDMETILNINETISSLMKSYYQKEKINEDEILLKLDGLNNYKKTLSLTLLGLINGNVDLIDICLDELMPVFDNLDGFDIEICGLAQVVSYYHKKQYLELLSLLDVCQNAFRDEYIISLLKYYRFMTIGHIGYYLPKKCYEEALESLMKYGSPLAHELQKNYLTFLVVMNNSSIYNPLFPKHLLDDNYKAYHNYLVNQDSSMINNTNGWIKAFLAYKINDRDLLKEIYESSFASNSLSEVDRLLIGYYYSLAFLSPKEIRDYILNIGLPFSYSNSNFTLMTEMLDMLSWASMACSKYKETIRNLDKYIKFVKEIKKYCLA